MKRVTTFVSAMVLSLGISCAFAADDVPQKKQTSLGLYMTAQQAYEAKVSQPSTLFVDVRTRSEVNFLGMPTMADANIPFMELLDLPEWNEKGGSFMLESNKDFIAYIDKLVAAKGLNKSSLIVVMCRSGDRSAKAVDLMAKSGYTNVYSILDGYEGDMAKEGPNAGRRAVNGWKNAGLPWSYKLDRNKMYFN